VASRLSHHKDATEGCHIPSSCNSVCIHIISALAFTMALYSASMLEREIVGYLQALHDTRFDPKNMANPPIDRLSSRHPAQSASENSLTSMEGDFSICNPTFKVPLTNLSILLIAVRCTVVGACKY
jgi:hypothetical protein